MSLKHKAMEDVFSCGYKAAIVVAGGGSGAVHQLLSTPGASRFIYEVQIPYSPRSMTDYLGETLSQFCSKESAEIMAGRAFERALIFSLSDEDRPAIMGIACTAALATDRERKGSDRAFICVKSRNRLIHRDVEFDQRERAAQEEQVSTELLRAITECLSQGRR